MGALIILLRFIRNGWLVSFPWKAAAFLFSTGTKIDVIARCIARTTLYCALRRTCWQPIRLIGCFGRHMEERRSEA